MEEVMVGRGLTTGESLPSTPAIMLLLAGVLDSSVVMGCSSGPSAAFSSWSKGSSRVSLL